MNTPFCVMNWIDYSLIALAVGIAIWAFTTGIWTAQDVGFIINIILSLLG